MWRQRCKYEIRGSHRAVAEDSSLKGRGCVAGYFLMFRRILVPSSSGSSSTRREALELCISEDEDIRSI